MSLGGDRLPMPENVREVSSPSPALERALTLRPVDAEADFSRHRWTVDEPADLEFVRAVTKRVDVMAGWREVAALVETDPALAALNSGVSQKSTHS